MDEPKLVAVGGPIADRLEELTPIQDHMLNMFLALRVGVGVIGLALPIILGCVGYFGYGIPLGGSMSSYYHATSVCPVKPAADEKVTSKAESAGKPDELCTPGAGPLRNWFVGSLFFIGGAMLLMRGFSLLEDWLLNFAGILGPCVGLFPMDWGRHSGFNPHQTCAISFFICIGLTAIFCSTKTLSAIPDDFPHRDKVIAFYRSWYWFFGALMIAAPICARILFDGWPITTFMVEAAGAWAFGLFWIFKTFELRKTQVEKRVVRGQIDTKRRSLKWEGPREPVREAAPVQP